MAESDNGRTRIITGSTGFLGSHLPARFIEREEDSWVLVRGDEPMGRVRQAVRAAVSSYGPSRNPEISLARVEAVAGDICADGCGLSPSNVKRLRAVGGGEFWHVASSLQFHDNDRDAIHACNVVGVSNAVQLAERVGCRRFVYISTAYTAGTKVGDIAEELHDPGGGFNNYYEQSKCLAEHIVVAQCEARELEWQILRPSIIVGPLATYESGGSNTGMYGFIRLPAAMQQPLQQAGRPVRIACDPTTPFNLVPVDWVAADVDTLANEDFGRRRIHHLVTDNTITVGYSLNELSAELGLPGFETVSGPPEDPTELEEAIATGAVFYGAYLRNAKSFHVPFLRGAGSARTRPGSSGSRI